MLVIGTGAVASFMVPRLMAAGQVPQVFGSPSPRLAALRDYTSAVSDPRAVQEHEGWLVLCKSWQNGAKLEQLRSVPRPRTILVLQNGLAPEADWTLPEVSVERGLSTYGLASLGPGLSLGGERGEIVLPLGSVWREVLRAAGLQVREVQEMAPAVWAKLVVNASLNVVAALHDLRNGEVLERPATRRLAAAAAREVACLARHDGVDLQGLDPVQVMEGVARGTAGNICSTLADLRSGRPTEYDSINGAVLRRARALGLALPTLEKLDRRFSALREVGAKRRA